MSEETSKESNVKTTIDAVTGLVKAVPVYEDAIQAAAKQVGKSLETVTKVVNIALLPLTGLVWGYEQIGGWLGNKLSDKLKDVPEDKIITPDPQIAGPAVEALRFISIHESLRELYANLLATAMDKDTVHLAHPSYVEVLKNLSTDEAIILQSFIGFDTYPIVDVLGRIKRSVTGAYSSRYLNFTPFHYESSINRLDLIPAYLDNLGRLGLLEKLEGQAITDATEKYVELSNSKWLDRYRREISEDDQIVEYRFGAIRLTSFGKQFVENVVIEKTSQNNS